MRFGRSLQKAIFPAWKDSYIDYTKLKELLREPQSTNSSPVQSHDSRSSNQEDVWTEEDERAFAAELLNVQLQKVIGFQRRIVDELHQDMVRCERTLKSLEPAVATAVAAMAVDKGRKRSTTTTTTTTTTDRQALDSLSANVANSSTPAQKPAGRDKGKETKPEGLYTDEETGQELQSAHRALEAATSKLTELEKYTRINYTGFLKAVKKHDRKRGHLYKIRPMLQAKLTDLSALQDGHASFLYRLSVMYSFIRHGLTAVGYETAVDAGASAEVADEMVDPDGFTSHKFWVHPNNILEAKTVILRELPVLVYNPQPSQKSSSESYQDPSITSVYLDNAAFDLYNQKVCQSETATSVRLRWHGQLADGPDIVIEQKTHGRPNSRLGIKDKNIAAFLAGSYDLDKEVRKLRERTPGTAGPLPADGPSGPVVAAVGLDSGGMTGRQAKTPTTGPKTSTVTAGLSGPAAAAATPADELRQKANLIQAFITRRHLQPMLRATYRRTAYEIPRDDRVRISIDSDVVFVREDIGRSGDSWHRADLDGPVGDPTFGSVPADQVCRFPYAVLDVRVQNRYRHSPAGRWVDELMASHLVAAAHQFSKFAHGVAVLFEDQVNEFPLWLSRIETNIWRDPKAAFEAQQAQMARDAADELAVGSLRDTAAAGSLPSRTAGLDDGAVLSPVGQSMFESMTERKSVGRASDGVGDDEDEEDEDDSSVSGSDNLVDGAGDNGPNRLSLLIPPFFARRHASHGDGSGVMANAPLPPGLSAPSYWLKNRGPVQIEAKVWLANQRTFIKWMHISVLLGALSVALYNSASSSNGGSSNRSGFSDPYVAAVAVVYLAIAVFAGVWGWNMYLYRADLIRSRSGKDLSAPVGPVVVTVALAGALVVNFWIKVRGMW